jgi:phosphoribosylamine--glycine ligase
MGAYAPAPIFTANMIDEALELVLKPAVSGLRSEGSLFVGVLYAGLILTPNGMRVLEFNCRFGDPETQVVLPLLETDLLEIAEACIQGRLAEVDIRWKQGAAVCAVLAGKGYPEKVETGKLVTMEDLPQDMVCFHAGTKIENRHLITSGGRVFGLTAWAGDIESAANQVYGNVEKISFAGMQYRKDIAHRALEGAK